MGSTLFGPKGKSETEFVVEAGSPGRSGSEGHARGEEPLSSRQDDVTKQSSLNPPLERASRIEAMPTLGKGPVPPDPRKFRYDRLRGRLGCTPWTVTKDDRMSAQEAGGTMERILRMYDIDRANEGDIEAFVTALLFSHTINGGSTLQPGRAVMSVSNTSFNYADIVRLLGTDIRRFFRAYANEIRDANKDILNNYDPYDPVAAEYHGWLMQVASERGLQRYPYLAHDSADACTDLSPPERTAVAASKRTVLACVDNSADAMLANPRVSAGKFNSSTLGMEFGGDAK